MRSRVMNYASKVNVQQGEGGWARPWETQLATKYVYARATGHDYKQSTPQKTRDCVGVGRAQWRGVVEERSRARPPTPTLPRGTLVLVLARVLGDVAGVGGDGSWIHGLQG